MAVTLNWVGGEHEFALKLGQLRKLQESCNAGPEEVLNRLRFGTWKVDDVIEPIRLGLIGGGMTNAEAGPKVTTLVEQHPLAQFKMTALAIMSDALFAPKDDPLGEGEGETAPPENGGSPTSTEAAQ